MFQEFIEVLDQLLVNFLFLITVVERLCEFDRLNLLDI